MKVTIYSLFIVALFASCSTTKPIGTDGLVTYFAATIEANSLRNPDTRYYKQTIDPAEISNYRTILWDAWKKANVPRLATWTGVTHDSLIWQLPDNRKMLYAVLTKGEKPANGYPLFINLHGGGCFPDEPGPWTSRANSSEWQAAKTLGKRYDDAPSLYFVPRMTDDRRGRWYHRAPMAAYIRA